MPVIKKWSESFVIDGENLPVKLQDFRWRGFSNLVTNNLRWILAEFIVSMAVGATEKPRDEWDSYDVITPEGIKLEVKSASYNQSREQTKFSTISFSIRPTQWWVDEMRDVVAKRQADMYVFCLLKHKDKATINPLDLWQREFYVVPVNRLNEGLWAQKTLSLGRLQKLVERPVSYHELRGAIVA